MVKKESVTLNARISKKIYEKIKLDVENGYFTDTISSVVNKILEDHYNEKGS